MTNIDVNQRTTALNPPIAFAIDAIAAIRYVINLKKAYGYSVWNHYLPS